MEHGEETDGCPEMFRIAGYRQQGFGAGAEKDAVDQRLVLQRHLGNGFRQREYDVEIFDGQQFELPAFDPCGARQRLALGTMAVTAGVIAVASVGAVAAFFEVAAQSGRTADLDGAHHPQMIARQGMRLPVVRAVLSKNGGQLQSGPRHGNLSAWGGGWSCARAGRVGPDGRAGSLLR